MLSRFGVRTTLVEVADRLLPREEPRIGELMQGFLEEEGIEVHVGSLGAPGDSRGRRGSG